MSTMSKSIASNTTTDMNAYSNTRYILEDPTLEEPMPTWARVLMKKIDQIDMRLQKLASPTMANSWEANSLQIEILKEPINDHLDSSNVVSSNDYYPNDRIDYQYNEVRVDIPMIKEVDDPKEYLNEDMTSSLPKTIQSTNLTLEQIIPLGVLIADK